MIDGELRAAAHRVLDACRAKNLKLAVAESCTGGLLAATLTEIPGSSDVLERFGEFAERDVEHRAHQGPEHPAAELVRDEELDLAGVLRHRVKNPMVLHLPERAVEIFDQNAQPRPVERHFAGEGLADHLVG